VKAHDCKACKRPDCIECLNCQKQEQLLALLKPATKKQKATALQYLVAQPMEVKEKR